MAIEVNLYSCSRGFLFDRSANSPKFVVVRDACFSQAGLSVLFSTPVSLNLARAYNL